MNTAIVNIEMQTSDIPALKDFLKNFKTSSIKIEEKNVYSGEFAEKIRQARKERERGETIKISSENLSIKSSFSL